MLLPLLRTGSFFWPNWACSSPKDAFCAQFGPGCSTWVRRLDVFRSSFQLKAEQVVIAVKTVEKFHSVRLPLLREFWTDDSEVEVLFLSNTGAPLRSEAAGGGDSKVVDLSKEFGDMVDPSKESTKHGSGHCTKMQAILRYLHKYQPNKRWYVVTDDDTLVNVPRLLRVLNSHDDTQAVYLGERYGWSHMQDREGTNYITTGAGMALSARALAELLGCGSCSCRSPDAPDDMSMGSWFRALHVQPTLGPREMECSFLRAPCLGWLESGVFLSGQLVWGGWKEKPPFGGGEVGVSFFEGTCFEAG
ncbi:unnamed protein product [Effrenium voratum]|nr:unnamed protein product [Effrenium voratum]